MPLYNTLNPPPSLGPLYPTNQAKVFNADTLVAGTYSQQLNIGPGPSGSSVSLSFDGDFSAAPGTFTLQIVEADTDQISPTNKYRQIGSDITVVLTGTTTAVRVDIAEFQGQFVAVYVKAATQNAVTFTAQFTRR
jgi:hypothetical protein